MVYGLAAVDVPAVEGDDDGDGIGGEGETKSEEDEGDGWGERSAGGSESGESARRERRDEERERGGSARANRVRFAFGGVGDRSGRSSIRAKRGRSDGERPDGSTITVQGGADRRLGRRKLNLLSRFTRNEFAWSPSPPSASNSPLVLSRSALISLTFRSGREERRGSVERRERREER
ncbi:hypothetical protein Syun_021552 [Stephania yunnanensis]|uniref:Uncharacterized protein n=1 Tax=Stephania yunnanensis TaxID=152371 RepID=A0AAP0IG97_9MAGN